MDSLVPLYKEMARTDTANFCGLSILQHQKSIAKLIRQVGVRTVLDYGCGRGDAYRSPYKTHQAWFVSRKNITLYDPAFHANSAPPSGQYDVVLCSDVLEHIPEHEVEEFIARLFLYARKAVWASVCCRPAKKLFADGTNMHVTVKPYEWWHETFGRLAPPGVQWVLVETP
jgi:hypothetical protein